MSNDKDFTNIGACEICRQTKNKAELIPMKSIRPSVSSVILKEHPATSMEGYICMKDLNHYRVEHIEELMRSELGVLSELEAEVVRSLSEEELVSQNMNQQFDAHITLGERVADKVAEFGGSWKFISFFGAFILAWILINSLVLLSNAYDPYPFILLNLILSCLASIQAPVIMMSQNRQEAKDRMRSEQDFKVNLKAELEIRLMHEKIDHLLNHQWQSLLESQQMIMDMISESNLETEGMLEVGSNKPNGILEKDR